MLFILAYDKEDTANRANAFVLGQVVAQEVERGVNAFIPR